jgi:hypothetical protein
MIPCLLSSSSHFLLSSFLGGIEIASSRKIVNARPTLYGSSNDTKKRKKVRNKIDYWKARGKVAFLEVAKAFESGLLSSPPPRPPSSPCSPSSPRQHISEQIESTPRRSSTVFGRVVSTPRRPSSSKPTAVSTPRQPSQQSRSITPRNIAAAFSPRIMSTTKYEGKCFVLSLFILFASLFYSHFPILNLPQTSLRSTLTTRSSRAISSLLFTTKSRCPSITTCETSFALISITSISATS